MVCSSAEIKEEEEETHQAQKESVRRHTEEKTKTERCWTRATPEEEDGRAGRLLPYRLSFFISLYLSVAESFRLDCRRILETEKPKITFSRRDVGHHHQRVSKDGGQKQQHTRRVRLYSKSFNKSLTIRVLARRKMPPPLKVLEGIGGRQLQVKSFMSF